VELAQEQELAQVEHRSAHLTDVLRGYALDVTLPRSSSGSPVATAGVVDVLRARARSVSALRERRAGAVDRVKRLAPARLRAA
jgi:hypothetical protein